MLGRLKGLTKLVLGVSGTASKNGIKSFISKAADATSKAGHAAVDAAVHYVNYDSTALKNTLKQFSLPNKDSNLSSKGKEKLENMIVINNLLKACNYDLNKFLGVKTLDHFFKCLFPKEEDRANFIDKSYKVLSSGTYNTDKAFIKMLSWKFEALKNVADIMMERYLDKIVLPLINVSTSRICEFYSGDKKYVFLFLGITKSDYTAIITNKEAMCSIAKTIADTPLQNEIADYMHALTKLVPLDTEELITNDYSEYVQDLYSSYGYDL